MSAKKRRSKQPVTKPSAAKVAAPSALRLAAGVAIAAITTYLGLGFSLLGAVVVVPLAVGLLVSVTFEDWRYSAAVAAVGSLLGSILASRQFSPAGYAAALQNMPAYSNPDVLQQLLYGDVIGHIVNSGAFSTSGSAALVIIVGTLLAGIAGAAPGMIGLLKKPAARTTVGWVVTGLAIVSFAVTAWQATPTFRAEIAVPPADGQYAYDAHIYLRTYYEMAKGDGYYRSLVRAAAGDKRLIDESGVKNGLFVTWASSPTLIREPLQFYLWRLVAPNDAVGIFTFSLIACAAVMALLHWALVRFAGATAAFASWALWPTLLLATTWHNIFFPDWWMALALLLSVAFWLRGRLYPALAAALVAALFRDVGVLWLLALGVYALVRAVRDRASDRRVPSLAGLAGAAGSLVLFAGLYWLHLRAGSAVITPNLPAPLTFIGRLQTSAAATLPAKFLAPAEYMMFPYGRFAIPGVAYLIAAPFAWWIAQRRGVERPDMLSTAVLPAYVVFWVLFTATVGAASSYWGQGYMPLTVLGIASMLAVLAAHPRGNISNPGTSNAARW